MSGLKNVMLSMVWILSDTVLRSVSSTLFLLSTLTSISSACPFCGPVETPLSYSIARSSDVAIGESLSEAVANRQGQRRQFFSLLSRIVPTSSGKKIISVESAMPPVEAAVETTFSGTALLFNLPAVGWTAIAADEMFIGYTLQIPPLKQRIFKDKNRLEWFAQWLDHPNQAISKDAYAEFALAPFQEVRDSAHAFSPAEVVDHLHELSLQQQRRGFYGMVAGVLARQSPKGSQSSCRNALIHIITEHQSNDFQAGLDGIMAGLFIALGKRSLPVLERQGLFENEASPVDQRHLLQALRFCWEYPSDTVPRTEVVFITRKLLPVPHLTREVIVDLSRYQDWDFRNQIVAMWDTLGGEGPLIRPAIVGYLLACPSEKSASLLAQLREKNIDLFEKAQQAAAIPFPAAAP